MADIFLRWHSSEETDSVNRTERSLGSLAGLLSMLETMSNVTVLYMHALLEPQHVRAQSMPAH